MKTFKLKFNPTRLDYNSLIADRDHHGNLKASLGKIAFWLVLLPAMYIWLFTSSDIKASHQETLYAVVAYNLMKKSSLFGGPQRMPPPLGRDEEEEITNRPERFQIEGER